jgi:hypothetical protein
MRNVKYILFVLLIIMMTAPGIQKAFHVVDVKPLHGDFILAEKPVLSTMLWLDGSFQKEYDNYLEQHIGFRPWLVRLRNQLDFSFFRKANAEGVSIGKDDFLFEYDYIRASTGKDFVGQKINREKINRLKFLQEYLKDSLDIDLILVFEPGKASFYPEYIPDRFLTEVHPETNYSSLLKAAREVGVSFLDLNQYFLYLKDKAAYPLFPKYGTHWSEYGMSFAVDTLLSIIEQCRNIELCEVNHDSIFTSLEPLKTDNDVEKPMNLLFSLPSAPLAYPVFEFDTGCTIEKPMVLVIADSYYWNIFNTRIPANVFANEAFWYFNAKVFPDSYYKPLFVKDLNLKKEIEKQDLIFLMVTERFMYKFDWGFIDALYRLYTPAGLQWPMYDEATHMVHDEKWFESLINKAGNTNLSLEEVIWNEAGYQFSKKNKILFLQEFGAVYYERIIKADKKWVAGIATKARKKKTTFDEMLRLNAEYVFRKNYPELYRKFHRTRYFEESIRQDSLLLLQAKNLASFYHCPLNRVIRYRAGLMAEKENK